MIPPDILEFLATASFKAADKAFKFISWAIIIVALKYADDVRPNKTLEFVAPMLTLFWLLTLVFQLFWFFERQPETLGAPPRPYIYIAISIIKIVIAISSMFLFYHSNHYIEDLFIALEASKAK